ncbi:MAG: hypothetical protein ACYTFM_07645 [Planctomycetota bacterium]
MRHQKVYRDVFHGAYLVGLVKGWDLRRIATFASTVSVIHFTVLRNRKGVICQNKTGWPASQQTSRIHSS